MSPVMSLDELKVVLAEKLKKNEPVAGLQFRNSRGSVGTILPELSTRGKMQASMTCIYGGPNHIRECSDWHQCSFHPSMQSKKARKAVKAEEPVVVIIPDNEA